MATPREKLAVWLRVTGWIYAAGGLLFLAAPDALLGSINQASRAVTPDLPPMPIHPDPRFWLILTGAMMATIAACALYGAADLERRLDLAVPIVVSKLTSSALGIGFFILSARHLGYLVIVLTDLPLGIVTALLYARARGDQVGSTRAPP